MWMTRTVLGSPKRQDWRWSCCCPFPRPSSYTDAPGLAWPSLSCFPPLPTASLPSLAWRLLTTWTVLFREVFVQLCSSLILWEVRRMCGVGDRLPLPECSGRFSNFTVSSLHGEELEGWHFKRVFNPHPVTSCVLICLILIIIVILIIFTYFHRH